MPENPFEKISSYGGVAIALAYIIEKVLDKLRTIHKEDSELDLKTSELSAKQNEQLHKNKDAWIAALEEALKVAKAERQKAEEELDRAEQTMRQLGAGARFLNSRREDDSSLIHRILRYCRQGDMPSPELIAEMERREKEPDAYPISPTPGAPPT